MGNPDLLTKILSWAESNENILAVVQTGSHVRKGARVDEYSDYDIELIAADKGLLSKDDTWLKEFGDIWVLLALNEGQEYPTRLVVYKDGNKVDFTLADKEWINNLIQRGLDTNYERGYKVLIDKLGITKGLPSLTQGFPKKELPTQKEYFDTVNEFWFEASQIPKYLVRQELWIVKFRDWTMKEMLLKMLEWYALIQNKEPIDVWYIGSHMKDWLDTEIWDELQNTFAHLDVGDSFEALQAEIKLFRRVAKSVAEKMGYGYPSSQDKNLSEYIASFQDKL